MRPRGRVLRRPVLRQQGLPLRSLYRAPGRSHLLQLLPGGVPGRLQVPPDLRRRQRSPLCLRLQLPLPLPSLPGGLRLFGRMGGKGGLHRVRQRRFLLWRNLRRSDSMPHRIHLQGSRNHPRHHGKPLHPRCWPLFLLPPLRQAHPRHFLPQLQRVGDLQGHPVLHSGRTLRVRCPRRFRRRLQRPRRRLRRRRRRARLRRRKSLHQREMPREGGLPDHPARRPRVR